LDLVVDNEREMDRIFDYMFDISKINMIYHPHRDKVDRLLAHIINEK